MKPSERIAIIKDIATALSKESWNLIDLTLKQFGLPWTNNWNGGDREDYVINMIGDSDDSKLLELGKHVGAASVLGSVDPPIFWQEEKPRIFLSHISAKRTVVAALKNELERYGMAAFVAHDDIKPTKPWQDEIESALVTMDALIAILHPGFSESNWTDQEVGVAIGRRVPIIALRAGLDPYGFIGKYQALPAKGRGVDKIAIEVIELLAEKPQISSKISRALIDKLKKSNSWAESKGLMDLIEKCQHFSPAAIKELRAAVADNNQVESAWGVPERVAKIVEAHSG